MSYRYLPVIASYLMRLATFSMQWVGVAVFIVTILCISAGQALKTISHFLA